MFVKLVTVAMLALSLLATAGSAQTAAELLQKGIYTQETAGDLDAAIQIYRQVISSAGNHARWQPRRKCGLWSASCKRETPPAPRGNSTSLCKNYADQKEIDRLDRRPRMGAVLRTSGTSPPQLRSSRRVRLRMACITTPPPGPRSGSGRLVDFR